MFLQDRASYSSQAVHDDIYTPEHDFFLVVLVYFLLIEWSADVIEYTQDEPHPEIVLASELIWFAIVNCVFQIVFAYFQQSVAVYINKLVTFFS